MSEVTVRNAQTAQCITSVIPCERIQITAVIGMRLSRSGRDVQIIIVLMMQKINDTIGSNNEFNQMKHV